MEKKFIIAWLIGQLTLAVIMFLLMTASFGYHLFAGNLNLFTFACFAGMWTITYKFVVWSVAELKEEKANANSNK